VPALAGDPKQGWAAINPELHFHDLRHTQKTWLIEDQVPRVLQLQRLGHKPKDVSDIYSHVTLIMIEAMLAALRTRWDQYSTWVWSDADESSAA
jgi:integrase